MSAGQHYVRLMPAAEDPTGPAERWDAELVASAAEMVLWTGEGATVVLALCDLAENLADELEERARFLPDGYRDLVVREPGEQPAPSPSVDLAERARRVVLDYGHQCDDLTSCDCSMAQLARAFDVAAPLPAEGVTP